MLAVRLAERAVMAAELGVSPVLLLDDALAELDPLRQARLMDVDEDAQVVLTVTAPPSTTRFVHRVVIEAGTVREEVVND
jgi:recombinational DNA repair ATPase RecF